MTRFIRKNIYTYIFVQYEGDLAELELNSAYRGTS